MSESILFFSIIKIDSDIRQNDIMPLNTGNCITVILADRMIELSEGRFKFIP